jgi:hypothetical protein
LSASDNPAPFALVDQIACVKREIAMRERTYPRWVSTGQMSKAKAAHETACMSAVLVTLLDLQRERSDGK